MSPIAKSVYEGEVDLYGCFSPRGTHITDVMTLVLQIMSELHELCKAPSSPMSIVLPKVMGLVIPMMCHR